MMTMTNKYHCNTCGKWLICSAIAGWHCRNPKCQELYRTKMLDVEITISPKHATDWMTEVFTPKKIESLNKKVVKLSKKERSEGKKVSVTGYEILLDQILGENSNNELDNPFELPRGHVVEHFTRINKNLFFTYPDFFDGEHFKILQQNAKKAGFKVRVDPYASRLVGGNIRIVIWKPNIENTTP